MKGGENTMRAKNFGATVEMHNVIHSENVGIVEDVIQLFIKKDLSYQQAVAVLALVQEELKETKLTY